MHTVDRNAAEGEPGLPTQAGASGADTQRHDGINFRVPRDLEVTPTKISNVLLVGQCILNAWSYQLCRQHPGLEVEQILFNFTAELPDQPKRPLDQYDFQIVA